MMPKDDEMISLKDALDLMIANGMTRRQAKRTLMRGLREGRIHSDAVVEKAGMMLGRQNIPSEFWEGPWQDNEGDKGD
jgi:hypothetical protein